MKIHRWQVCEENTLLESINNVHCEHSLYLTVKKAFPENKKSSLETQTDILPLPLKYYSYLCSVSQSNITTWKLKHVKPKSLEGVINQPRGDWSLHNNLRQNFNCALESLSNTLFPFIHLHPLYWNRLMRFLPYFFKLQQKVTNIQHSPVEISLLGEMSEISGCLWVAEVLYIALEENINRSNENHTSRTDYGAVFFFTGCHISQQKHSFVITVSFWAPQQGRKGSFSGLILCILGFSGPSPWVLIPCKEREPSVRR